MDLFLLKKALTALVLPPTGPLLLALIGLAIERVRPRLGRSLAWIGVVALAALSLPAISDALQRVLNESPALDLAQANRAQAIVVLGGGIRRAAPEYAGDTLGRSEERRVG